MLNMAPFVFVVHETLRTSMARIILETRPQGGKAAWGILFACATVLIILKTLDNEPYRLASA